ncbi:MAG TPA: hypothetical protein VL371_05335 [Gemmataceae bacterium]|jgi:hypothetical protein|nr:hypothetical protein [Gemmataceae bacterium]
MYAAEFPAIVPSLAVYVVVTECQGASPLLVRVIDVNEEREAVAIYEIEANTLDPLAVIETDFEFTELEFLQAGEYSVQLLARGAIVLERRLVVALAPE